MPALPAACPKREADELAALVGVMDESRSGTSAGAAPSAARRRRARCACGRPSTSRRSGGCRRPGAASRPALAVDEVISDPDAGHPDRCRAALRLHQAADLRAARHPLHALSAKARTLRGLQTQLGMDAPSAVDAAIGRVDRLDLLESATHRSAPDPTVPASTSHRSPTGSTPSSRHCMETGVRAFSAEMNR